MPNIYNFFKFIEEKTGNWPGEDEGFAAKCKYAPELVTDIDLENTTPEFKFAFFPEKLKKKDLYVNNLEFGRYTWDSVNSLPENLWVKNSLDIEYTRIKILPTGLRVGGSVYANNSLLEEIGEDIQITDDLHIAKTPLASMQLNSGWFDVRRELERKGGNIDGRIELGFDDDEDDYYD